MRRMLAVIGTLLAAALLTFGATTSLGNSGHAAKHSDVVQIQSWLLVNPSATMLSATVKACFKLSGAFTDEGGRPTWTDSTYASVPADPADLAGKCGDWTPVGGAIFVPPVTGNLSTLSAVHTITGHKGQINVAFSGTDDFVATFTGSGIWVITGETGAYKGVHGEGTWAADATTLGHGYIRHTEEGVMSK